MGECLLTDIDIGLYINPGRAEYGPAVPSGSEYARRGVSDG